MGRALQEALRGMTALHPRPGGPSTHRSLTDALESADRELVGGTGRVRRTDLPPADLELFDQTSRLLQGVAEDLSHVTAVAFYQIPAFLADRRRQLAQALDWIEELTTRDLEPRTAVEVLAPWASPNMQLSTLTVPAPARAALEDLELYTVADVVESENAGQVLRDHLDVAVTVADAARQAGLTLPQWLLELTSDDRLRPATRLEDLEKSLPKQTTRALAAADINTVGDLTQRTAKQLRAVKNIGEDRARGVEELLAQYDLALASAQDNKKGGKRGGQNAQPGTGTGGTGKVVWVGPNRDAKVITGAGEHVYVPVHEVKSLGVTVEIGWTLRFQESTPTDRKPRARGVSLAVPDVVGSRLGEARATLDRQGLTVVIDAPGLAEHADNHWRVQTQSPPTGSGYTIGDVITLGVARR